MTLKSVVPFKVRLPLLLICPVPDRSRVGRPTLEPMLTTPSLEAVKVSAPATVTLVVVLVAVIDTLTGVAVEKPIPLTVTLVGIFTAVKLPVRLAGAKAKLVIAVVCPVPSSVTLPARIPAFISEPRYDTTEDCLKSRLVTRRGTALAVIVLLPAKLIEDAGASLPVSKMSTPPLTSAVTVPAAVAPFVPKKKLPPLAVLRLKLLGVEWAFGGAGILPTIKRTRPPTMEVVELVVAFAVNVARLPALIEPLVPSVF